MAGRDELLKTFSNEFQEAFKKMMDDEFPSQDALIQLGVFRELITNMTSGFGSIKTDLEAKNTKMMMHEKVIQELVHEVREIQNEAAKKAANAKKHEKSILDNSNHEHEELVRRRGRV